MRVEPARAAGGLARATATRPPRLLRFSCGAPPLRFRSIATRHGRFFVVEPARAAGGLARKNPLRWILMPVTRANASMRLQLANASQGLPSQAGGGRAGKTRSFGRPRAENRLRRFSADSSSQMRLRRAKPPVSPPLVWDSFAPIRPRRGRIGACPRKRIRAPMGSFFCSSEPA